MRKIIIFICCLALVYGVFKFISPKPFEGMAEYWSPTWMDNEHIICVKYVRTYQPWLFKFLGDLADASVKLVDSKIQIVSMDIEGKNEKAIKSIVITYPRQSPTWKEKMFKGVLRINSIDYSPQKKLVAFDTHGYANSPLFIIKEDGTDAKKLVEPAGGPRFSPNGKYLQYTSDYKVWLYDLDKDEHKVLIEDAAGGPWSPDGKKIAFSRKSKEKPWQCDVYIYDVERKKEELWDSNSSYVNEWPSDYRVDYGRIIQERAIQVDGEDKRHRYETIISDITKEGVIERVNLGEVKSAIWGNDSNTVIYVKDDYFWKLDIKNKLNQKLFKSYYIDGVWEYLYPTKHLDNERLLAIDRYGNFYVYDLNKGEIIAEVKGRFSFISYSPDKTKILANSKQGLCVVEIDSLQYKQLLNQEAYVY